MELAVALVFAGLTLHPFTTFPATLLTYKNRPLSPSTKQPQRIALLFCCHNEEKSLPAKIANLRKLLAADPKLSVHVYLDACTDASNRLLASIPQVHLYKGRNRKGKNHGLNTMMKRVDADIIAFNDANTIIDANAFKNVRRYFTDLNLGCVTAHLRYTNNNETTTANVGGLYWRFEEWLKRRESAVGSTVAVDGSLFFIRRELFTTLPADVPNDFYTSIDILSRGYRVISARDVCCTEKSATSSTEEFRRKVRITTRAMTAHLILRHRLKRLPISIRYIYASHKLLRWFTAYWIALCIVSLALAAHSYGLLAPFTEFLSVTAAITVLAHFFRLKPAGQLIDILLAFTATAYGASRALLGSRISTWTLPLSSR